MGLTGCYEFSDRKEYCAGLVITNLTCDQRCAFSENTTGTIWCFFQRELADKILIVPRHNCAQEILYGYTSFEEFQCCLINTLEGSYVILDMCIPAQV